MRVAAADIGTNSTRLLIADVVGGRLRPLERRVTVTGLGEGVDRNGRLGAAGVARTLEVLAVYRAAARDAGAAAMRVVATSAVRDAVDRAAFLDRAAEVLGARPEVIGGEEEAILSFRGAAGGAVGPPPYLVIDVGGGSTEFVFGVEAPTYVRSIDMGSRRATERFLPCHPAGGEALRAASGAVAEQFAAVDLPAVAGTVLGVGGTYTALAAIAFDLEAYDPDRVHGSVVLLATLDGMSRHLASLSLEEVAALPSLDPARGPVLLGGAIVAAEALRRSGCAEVTVSEADLLDGIARGLVESG